MSKSVAALSPAKALFLSAGTGFLALGWELVWTRVYNFTTASRAMAFGALLGSYLLGLAVGSLFSQRWQRLEREDPSAISSLAALIATANLIAFLVMPLVSWLVVGIAWPWTLLAVIFGSAFLGAILPILCHLSIPPDFHAGRRMSHIYLANIIGSGAGSLLTGFVFLEYISLPLLCALQTAAGCALAGWLAGWNPFSGKLWWRTGLGLLAAGAIYWLGYGGLYERLQYHDKYQWGMRFSRIVESRHGVITVDSHGTIYGNGAYDGTFETVLHGESWLVRPYLISALHPQPRRALMIGVSGGAWSQIIVNCPGLEEMVGVELSDAYLPVIADTPAVSSLLRNPKFHLVIDDGRRWLRRHPDDRFDLIVMNTTHHWREFAAALLSREFLELVKQHLAPGGLAAWNCTDSARAASTGLAVFPHSVMIINFFVGSCSPIVPDKARWRSLLQQWKLDDQPVFDSRDPARREELEHIVKFADTEGPWDLTQRFRWLNRTHLKQAFGAAPIITDDNLGHEYAWGNW